MKKKVTYLLFCFVFLFPLGLYSQTPPINDLCSNAIDISNQSWFAGNNYYSSLSCTDVRVGNSIPPQQATDMSCGISGIEGTIWYKFTSPVAGTVNLEIRNQSCSPATFVGSTTTVQGFVMKKNICADNSLDIIVACFDPPTAANFSTPFTAQAGQEYYVQIDTKKNTFTGCSNCAVSTYTCHSSCAFEVRVQFPIVAPIYFFEVSNNNNFVEINWMYDWKDNLTEFAVVRKNSSSGDSILLISQPIENFTQSKNIFKFNDFDITQGGLYTYELYGSIQGSDRELLGRKTIHYNSNNALLFELVPNPAESEITIILKNTHAENYAYSISNSLGQLIIDNHIALINEKNTPISISGLPTGIYTLTIILEDKVIQKQFCKK